METARVIGQETAIHSLAVPPWPALVEPEAVFAHPSEVLRAGDLSREQKRAILASWASDAYAVESAPALRHCPGGGRPVPLDDVLAALQALDADVDQRQGEAAHRSTRLDLRRQGRWHWLRPKRVKMGVN